MEKENENTMKNSVRFIVVALILAGVAALGFSRGAWAGPFMQGTVPFCPTTGTIYVNGQMTVKNTRNLMNLRLCILEILQKI